MAHILSNLPEEYETIVEIQEDKLDDKDNTLTIERIHDNILVKSYQMNKQPGPIISREDEKRVTAQVAGNMGTKEKTAIIKRV